LKTTLKAMTAIAMIAFATPAFAGDTKVSGKIFFDYGQTDITKAGIKKSTVGGNLTRTYLTVKHKLDDTWSARLTLDSAFDSTAGKKTQVNIKYAQLTGKFMPEANIKIGVIETPWIGYQDKLSKHRYISKSFTDKQKLDNSADAGVGVFGKIADGLLHYDATVMNGAGNGNLKRTDGQDLQARVGLNPFEGLTLDFGYRSGYKGTRLDSTVAGTKFTLTQAMITYGMDDTFRLGLNYVFSKAGARKGTAIDTWAWMKLSDDFGAFVNYEIAGTGITGGAAIEKRTIVSVDYNVAKKVLLSLAYTNVKNLKGIAGDSEKVIGLYSQFKL